jgi:uncharacterized protein YbcV (DUF1398 family)
MNSSVSKSIRDVWHDVHSAEGLPFPVTVGRLSKLGVVRYHVDYASKTISAYIGREVDVAPVPSLTTIEGVAAWSTEGIKEALRLVQSGSISYGEFSGLITEAGVTNYFAYLEGKKVIYMGGLGDVHVEWFPGARKD